MSDSEERHDLLVRLQIPAGHYCYEVVKHDEKTGIRHLRYCPFWYGFRPEGGCMIYGWDAALGDACKACGWLQPDEPIF
jgi:hypothetical protein